jgi:hypothetical protein
MQLRIIQLCMKARFFAFKNLDKKGWFLSRFLFTKHAFYSVDEYITYCLCLECIVM